MNKFKVFIKSIPILGWFIRFIYNILRINRTVHKIFILEKKLNKLNSLQENLYKDYQNLKINHKNFHKDYENLKINHQNLHKDYQNLRRRFDTQEQYAYDLVRKHISSQLIYFHQKIDKFIENSNQEKIINLKNDISQDFFDEYYLNFENKFRGSRESILKRYEEYLKFVPFFDNKNINQNFKTLDIGCGRGEWLELLQKRGINAYGIDMNPMMLKLAQENNLKNIEISDVFDYLNKCEDNSFDLITAFHIIEHIPFGKLVNLLQQIKRVAKPDATILLETPNPQNLQVAACNFYTDPTHLNPLPANMVKFLVQYLGFDDVKINYLNPMKSNSFQENSLETTAQDYLIEAKNSLSAYDKIKKKLFFDISSYKKNNLKTGIHRVVSKQLDNLKILKQDLYEIIPVYFEKDKYKVIDKNQDISNINFGDILFTSDLSYSDIQNATEYGVYESYKKLGMKIVFFVHDILPILYEEYFVKGTKQNHEKYIKNIIKVANLIITTTKAGKKELENYCQNITNIPKIEYLHLGSDLSTMISNENINKLSFLMVGTIEPRKAHEQVIKAFDIIWNNMEKNGIKNSLQPTLTIIGKEGWMVENTIKMIKEHPLLNKKLFYLTDVDDKKLIEKYNEANTIIVASHAEGFGLPLVEAMNYKKNIIARDIEVFKEIAKEYPIYFENSKEPQKIAITIDSYLKNIDNLSTKKVVNSNSNLTWEEHTLKLINILENKS